MRWLYLLAAFTVLAAGAVHVVIGGVDALAPVMASKAPLEARAAIMAVWHSQTFLYALSFIALLWAFARRGRARPLGFFLGILLLAHAALFAGLSFLWFEDVSVLPQWAFLAPAGLLALIAAI